MSVKQKAQVLYIRKVDEAARLLQDLEKPKEGWLAMLRKALGMSGPQLAKRAGVTKAAVYQVERKEMAGEVTIKQMEKMAKAMGGKFVYAVVPDASSIPMKERKLQEEEFRRGPVEQLMQTHARAKAEAIVKRASTHMALEQQGLSDVLNRNEIDRLASNMMAELGSDFWEDA